MPEKKHGTFISDMPLLGFNGHHRLRARLFDERVTRTPWDGFVCSVDLDGESLMLIAD